jgi:hypothetical protein
MTDIEQARECDVERVAQALWGAGVWDQLTEQGRKTTLAHATAAIAAMQPTIDAAIRSERDLVAKLREELVYTLQELIDHNGDSLDDGRQNRINELRTPPIDHDPGESSSGAFAHDLNGDADDE